MALQNNYNLQSVLYGNTFLGVRFQLPAEPSYILAGSTATMQLRKSENSPAVATFTLAHIDEFTLELSPFVVNIKAGTYYYDVLISFLDGREKTWVGGSWIIEPVITRK